MLAHGSGIDELIVLVAAVGTFLVVSTIARRRRGAGAAASERCRYCDRSLGPEAVRCDGCGFRARRDPARPG